MILLFILNVDKIILNKVFKVLPTYGILIVLQKWEFIKTSVSILRHIIEEGSIKPCIQNIGERC